MGTDNLFTGNTVALEGETDSDTRFRCANKQAAADI